MASQREVTVPDIGEFEGVDVIELLIATGDRWHAPASMLAAKAGKKDVVDLLIERGAVEGRLHSYGHGRWSVYCVRSDDGGKNWKAIRAADGRLSPLGHGFSETFPIISSDFL